MSKKCILLVGLPEAGKSSFIAALYHILQDRTSLDALKLQRLFGLNAGHLQKLERKWLSGEHLERTRIPDEIKAALSLLNPLTSEEIELHIPDMSGETYSQQWEKRICTKEYLEMLEEVSGILLFVHPEHIVEPASIFAANKLASTLGFKDIESDDGNEIAKNLNLPLWNPENACTQVKLVEILQFITSKFENTFNVAVVISAWDLVVAPSVTPLNYIGKRLPLLYQYLSTNPDHFYYKVYGISALGGSIDTKKTELLSILPAQRIIVADEDSSSNDITLPLQWLIKDKK